jgi:hypothetical protein
MESRRIVLAALACGSFFLSACGGDSEGTLAQPQPTLAPADAAAIEQGALLTVEDLPAGFQLITTSVSDGESSEPSAAREATADDEVPEQCEEFAASDFGDADSGDTKADFEMEDGTSLSHITSYAGELQTQDFMEMLKKSATPECLKSLVLAGFYEGADDGSVTVDSAYLARDALDQPLDHATFSGALEISSTADPSMKLSADLRFEFKRYGPLVSMISYFTFTDVSVDFPAVNAKLDQRVAAALA